MPHAGARPPGACPAEGSRAGEHFGFFVSVLGVPGFTIYTIICQFRFPGFACGSDTLPARVGRPSPPSRKHFSHPVAGAREESFRWEAPGPTVKNDYASGAIAGSSPSARRGRSEVGQQVAKEPGERARAPSKGHGGFEGQLASVEPVDEIDRSFASVCQPPGERPTHQGLEVRPAKQDSQAAGAAMTHERTDRTRLQWTVVAARTRELRALVHEERVRGEVGAIARYELAELGVIEPDRAAAGAEVDVDAGPALLDQETPAGRAPQALAFSFERTARPGTRLDCGPDLMGRETATPGSSRSSSSSCQMARPSPSRTV